MTKDEYKTKLRQFNSTEKYQQELDFLYRLMSPQPNEKILDYGCGLGTAVRQFNRHGGAQVFGYDIRNYRDQHDEHLFRSEYFFRFDKVYFMHSLAHIPDIEISLEALKLFLKPEAKIYVITPNQEWLITDQNKKTGYIPDPTVIQHFYITSLRELFLKLNFSITISGQFGNIVDSDLSEFINERLFLEAQWNG